MCTHARKSHFPYETPDFNNHIFFQVPAAPLVAASAMSAPAALAAAKLAFPSTRDEKVPERPDKDKKTRPEFFR